MVPSTSPGRCLVLVVIVSLLGTGNAKWVEGHIDTKERWAFLSRFCFLSLEGQFEYQIEFDKDMGTPNLLLYYDDDSQWPAVYHSSKTCKEREAVLNKAGQNQVIKLSHWYPDTEFSGCVITKENKELPASKSTTTVQPLPKVPMAPSEENNTGETPVPSPEPSYYDQFLKTTTVKPKSTIVDTNFTTWYEVVPTDEFETTTIEDELWESVGGNGSQFENLKDVELMFSNKDSSGHKIKRSTSELYERLKRRRIHGETNAAYSNSGNTGNTREKLIVSCHNSRRFRSARERWWFIAISNCDSPKGLDVRYKFLMTNGPEGDFWHYHFSADEFYVLPVLLAYTLAYVIVMVAVIMCSVELKSRHLLHSTYKLFLFSAAAQHCGLTLQALQYVSAAVNGYQRGANNYMGQFLCGISEMSFLLVLVLMAKGYSITRARLKLSFSVRLTIFMCIYCCMYLALLFYQAKAFDPGEVLYLYESPPGYALIALRICAWFVFAYATFFTVKKFPQKNMFYCPFFICGTLWFYAGPLFILTANSYIDKWVRESVVTAVLLFITFCGHIMFLLLTLPVFANKNFPYHVRTTQIGVMEVAGSGALDNFGHNPYQPGAGAPQTVIIPLTRRTEELIGNMYSQYMAPTPLTLDEHRLPIATLLPPPTLNNIPKRIESLSPKNRLEQQDSTDTNTSEDIKPTLSKTETEDETKDVFTIEGQMDKINSEFVGKLSPETSLSLVNGVPSPPEVASPTGSFRDSSRNLPLLRSRRAVLDPLPPGEPPQWSLARGPSVVAMMKKRTVEDDDLDSPSHDFLPAGKKVPAVRNGLPSSGEISTIHEGRVPTFSNTVSKATIDLFSVGSRS